MDAVGIDCQVVGEPMLFDVVFTGNEVADYRDMAMANAELSASYNKVLREQGIFKSSGKMYPSLALTDEDIQKTIESIAAAAGKMSA